MTALTVTATVTDAGGNTGSATATCDIGIAQPGASNTAVATISGGVATLTTELGTSTLTTVSTSGTVTLSTAGQTYSGKYLPNARIVVTAANVTIEDCVVGGGTPPTSGGTGLISTSGNGSTGLIIRRTEIAPTTVSAYWNGFQGNARLEQCNIHHVQDGAQVRAHPGSATQVPTFYRTWIHDLAYFTAAAGGDVHPSDVRTHNDGIQIFGDLIEATFCFLDARYARQSGHWVTTTLTEPYTTVALNSLPDGGPWQTIPDRGTALIVGQPSVEANGRYNGGAGSLSALMFNRSGDTPPHCCRNIKIEDNWFRGGNFCTNGGGNTNPGDGTFLGSVKRNRFWPDQGSQHSGNPDTVNWQGAGWTAALADIPTTGPDANVYWGGPNDALPVTVRF